MTNPLNQEYLRKKELQYDVIRFIFITINLHADDIHLFELRLAARIYRTFITFLQQPEPHVLADQDCLKISNEPALVREKIFEDNLKLGSEKSCTAVSGLLIALKRIEKKTMSLVKIIFEVA